MSDLDRARELVEAGESLREEKKYEEAIGKFDEIIASFRDSDELGLQEQVAKAMLYTGFALGNLGRVEQEIDAYDAVVRRFGERAEAALCEQVVWALYNKGVVLAQLDRVEEEIAAYDEVVERFRECAESALRKPASFALYNKGFTLVQLDRPAEAIAAYDEVVERFGECDEPVLREQVAKASANRGLVLWQLGQAAEAIAAWDEVARRYVGDSRPGTRDSVGRVLAWKARLLLQQGRLQDGQAALREAQRTHADIEAVRQLGAYAETLGEIDPDLLATVEETLAAFPEKERKRFINRMKKQAARTQEFLGEQTAFCPSLDELCLFLDLREWNSFTPAVPDEHEIDRGGGYFIRYGRQGIVIDPGYDFIKNFGIAGGRICDIDHIFLTHAHNDHTEDFESLLSLLYQYCRARPSRAKRVHLYFNQSAARKFSGFLPLRDLPYVAGVTILNPSMGGAPQTLALHELKGAKVTVLPAFHDDTLTVDYAIGLGFEFDFEDRARRVVFTGDTGLFPPKKTQEGEIELKDGDPVLDLRSACALHNVYPPAFKEPDLIVPHIGSVKEQELKPDFVPARSMRMQPDQIYFYRNHLGLRGLVALLAALKPRTVIVSEFGEELKEIRFKIVKKIGKLLQKRRSRGEDPIRVVPGDLTVIYDIGNDRFFCHREREFLPPAEIDFRDIPEPEESRFYCKDLRRTYFFRKQTPRPRQSDAVLEIRKFHLDMRAYGAPCTRKWVEHFQSGPATGP